MPRREVYPPYEHRNASRGCWAAVCALAGIGWSLPVLTPSLTPVAILASVPAGLTVWQELRVWRLTRRALRKRGSGIKGLLVYSRSPNWQPYIEQQWLPRIGGMLELLDWSDRARWRQSDPRVRLFETFIASDEDYNPAAVISRAGRPPLVFRFYPAFKNAKHGNREGLEELEMKFFAALEE